MPAPGFDFLTTLLNTPSPSGYETEIQQQVRQFISPFADAVRKDTHGNLFATRHATQPSQQKVLLAGHCDQIALMVQYVDADGFISVQPIGGWDIQIVLGQNLTLWSKTGPIPGVLARKAIHLLTPEERKKVPEFTDLWLDIGAKSKAEVDELVRSGDAITMQLGATLLKNNLAAATAMDDKVGVWVVMEAMRLLSGYYLQTSVVSVSTVAEEIGLRGATTATYSEAPTVGIAVDVCHATDTPGGDKKLLGEIKCGAGPVVYRGPNMNPKVVQLLEDVATANQIPIQVRGTPKATGTDANAIQISRTGVATGLIGIPNRYMHSPVEVIHLDDLANAAKLLAEFCKAVTAEHDWIP